MEKIFQILAVFVLLMLVITRFVRSREFKFREYIFLRRISHSLPPDISRRLLTTLLSPFAAPSPAADRENGLVFQRAPDTTGGLEIVDEGKGLVVALLEIDPVDALLFDPVTRLIYCCSVQGVLTIVRQTGREGQPERDDQSRREGQSGRDAYQVLQLLAVPPDGEWLALDPVDKKLYVGAGGYYFVFGPL
jgi:hypothetical protein